MSKLIYLANIRIPTEKAHGFQIMKMCEAFAENGQEVEMWVPRRLNFLKEDPFVFYNVNRNFKLVKIPCLDFNTGGHWGRWGFLIQTISFLIGAKLNSFFYPGALFYSREPWAGIFFKDYVLELHDLPKPIKKLNLFLWNQARKIVVLTRYLKEELVAEGINEDKISIEPDGVDLKDFDFLIDKIKLRAELKLPVDKKIVLYAGSFYLYDWKGVDILLEAEKYFAKDVALVLVGGSEQELSDLSKAGLSANVILRGRVSHSLIPRYLKCADILVLPNKTGSPNSEKYTSPLKLFEYMASGVPIVASDLPSLRAVLNEENAFLVKPNDSACLGSGINELLTKRELAESLKRQASIDILKYSWDKRAASILENLNLKR